MGITDDIGIAGVIPQIDFTGFFSASWIWVLVVVLAGLMFALGLTVFLFFVTYKKKVIVFENISGQGYQPILKTRARIVKLGIGGEELMKTLAGGMFLSAYGKKMGKQTYWYAKGQDGYLYNVVLGDLDAKQGILDIEPIDRDVRMFHVALDRLSHQTYGKQSFMEKYGVHLMLFLFLAVLIFGMWFIVGKIGDAVAPLGHSTETAMEIQKMNMDITARLEAVARALGQEVNLDKTPSGLVPADSGGGV